MWRCRPRDSAGCGCGCSCPGAAALLRLSAAQLAPNQDGCFWACGLQMLGVGLLGHVGDELLVG
ncbi:hypothetical protein MC885_015584 [Smutsia gigantea]|nr:hypothetical protein MC885_015584 [Smutsia gigantea]